MLVAFALVLVPGLARADELDGAWLATIPQGHMILADPSDPARPVGEESAAPTEEHDITIADLTTPASSATPETAETGATTSSTAIPTAESAGTKAGDNSVTPTGTKVATADSGSGKADTTTNTTAGSEIGTCEPALIEFVGTAVDTTQKVAETASTQLSGSDSNDDSTSPSSSDTVNAVAVTSSGPVVVEDEGLAPHEAAVILAEVVAGTTFDQFNAAIARIPGLSAEHVTPEDFAQGFVRLIVTDFIPLLDLIPQVKALDCIAGAQPNYVYKASGIKASGLSTTSDADDPDALEDIPYGSDFETGIGTTDDPDLWRQWGLFNTGALAAWDLVKTNQAVSVAIIDTGCDLDHPDLAANIVATYNSVSQANTIEDQVGHGTHVAGIIAGVANNGEGVAGVSYNAGLVIIKAAPFRSYDFDTAALVRAFNWLESKDASGKTVAEHYNVRVVNMSIGGVDQTRTANHPDDLLHQAFLKARDEYGLLVVVAAGNGRREDLPYFAYPSDSEACFSVMNLAEAYDEDGLPVGVKLEDNSNYNVPGFREKDICAPGTDVYSTWLRGGYASDTGTSMAAPFVSGVAALMFAAKPTMSPQECMAFIEATASDLGDAGWDETYGYGLVNAAAAVRSVNAAQLAGYDVVSVGHEGNTTTLVGSLGWGMQEAGGWSWLVDTGDGSAACNATTGEVTGYWAGDVTVYGSCTATTGAEICATRKVWVIDARIDGSAALVVGEASDAFAVVDTSGVYGSDLRAGGVSSIFAPGVRASEISFSDLCLCWVWAVESLGGAAHIGQDGILYADAPGRICVTATCGQNPNIVLSHYVTLLSA